MSQGNTPVSAGPVEGGVTGPVLYDLIRRGRSFSGREQHCCFLNLRDGRFADISTASGFSFPDDGRAVAQVDWDLDGDLDFWIANRNGPQLRFLDNSLHGADSLHRSDRFISLSLQGTSCNRDAIGARVEVALQGEPEPLLRTVRAGDGFLAQSSKKVHVGLGTGDVQSVTVRWPGGEPEVFSGIAAGGQYRLRQGSGQAEPIRASAMAPALETHAAKAHLASEAEPSVTSRVALASMSPVPPISYRSADGKPLRISGGPVVVNLWASWCGPCAEELSDWTKHAEELRNANLRVLALSVDALDDRHGQLEAAVHLIKRLQSPFEFGFAEQKTVEQLQSIHNHLFDVHQTLRVPTSLLIDREGRIAGWYRGRVSTDILLRDLAISEDRLQQRILASTPFPGRWHFHRTQLNPLDLVWQWLEQGWLDEALQVIQQHQQLLAEHYNYPKLLVLAGNGLVARGDAEAAIEKYRQALAISSEDADAHNNLAWLLATHPDDALRAGAEAVVHAERARQLNPDSPSVLDTLAAAYAEQGRFEEAAETLTRGIRLAESLGQAAQAQSMREHLRSCESSRPIRMQ